MKRLASAAAIVVALASLGACTPAQTAAFVCRVKFGPGVLAVIDASGNAECHRIDTDRNGTIASVENAAWHADHPNYCAEDDARWNGVDHQCVAIGTAIHTP